MTNQENPNLIDPTGRDDAALAQRARWLAEQHQQLLSGSDAAERGENSSLLDELDEDVALLRLIHRVREREPSSSTTKPWNVLAGDSTIEVREPKSSFELDDWLGDEVDRLTAPAREAPNDRSLGRFRIQSVLGRGGYGVVFDAIDPQLGRSVALKVPKIDNVTVEGRQRFVREAKAAGMLSHPQIVTVYESGQLGPVVYIAYELVRGPSLAQWLAGNPTRITVRGAAQLIARMAEAIQHAHSRAIIHRDLKPANILIDATTANPPLGEEDVIRSLKITDFGLAKVPMNDMQSLTESGAMLGTPNYMSPEQVRGHVAEIGPASDVYALGAILYELLVGTPPFCKATYIATLRAIEDQEPTAPRRLMAHVPRDLEAICLKCLEKKPAARFSSAATLADDLRAFLNGSPVQSRSISSIQRVGRWGARNPAVATLLSLLFLSLGIGLAATYLQFQSTRRQLEQTKTNYWQARKAVDELMVAASNPELESLPGVRRDLLQAALRYYAWFVSQDQDDPSLQNELVTAYRTIGSIAHRLGDFPASLDAYERAQTILDRITLDASPLEDKQTRLQNLIDVGLEQSGDGQLAAAQVVYARAIEEAESLLVQYPDDQVLYTMLARACSNLGYSFRLQGQSVEAKIHYERALAIRQQLVDKYPENQDFAHHKSAVHHNLAGWFVEQRQPADALAHARQANEILVTLSASDHAGLNCKMDLARSWNLLGDIYRNNRQLDDWAPRALDYYARAISIQEQLVKDNPLILKSQLALADSLQNLAQVYSLMGQTQTSIETYSNALDVLNGARQRSDTPDLCLALAVVQYNLATQFRAAQQPQRAHSEIASALRCFGELMEEHPELASLNRHWQRRMVLRKAQLDFELGNHSVALESMGEFLEQGEDGLQAPVLMSRILLFGEPASRDAVRALELMSGLLGRFPKSIQVHFYAGAALFYADRFEESLRIIDKSNELAGKPGPEQFIRAMCLKKLGRRDEAKKELANAKQWLAQQDSLTLSVAAEYAAIQAEAISLIEN